MATHDIQIRDGAALTRFTDAPLPRGRHNRVVVAQLRPALGWAAEVPDAGDGGAWDATALELWAVLDGDTEPPDDADLGGKPFVWSWGASPAGAPRPAIVPMFGGITGYQTATFDHRHVGTWALTCWRSDNGAVVLPIRVVLSVEGAPTL